VVEVQLVHSAANCTLGVVSFPHFKFNCSWDQPATFGSQMDRLREIFVADNGNQPEFENGAVRIALGPGVLEVKDAVVSPNARTELLVNTNALGAAQATLEGLRSMMKFSVLGQASRRMPLRLVDNLRIWARRDLRMIMALVYERCTAIFHAIPIRGIWANGHENDGMIVTEPEVHSLLKAGSLTLAHFDVRDNVVTHGALSDGQCADSGTVVSKSDTPHLVTAAAFAEINISMADFVNSMEAQRELRLLRDLQSGGLPPNYRLRD
jgi:hypothetical protein